MRGKEGTKRKRLIEEEGERKRRCVGTWGVFYRGGVAGKAVGRGVFWIDGDGPRTSTVDQVLRPAFRGLQLLPNNLDQGFFFSVERRNML